MAVRAPKSNTPCADNGAIRSLMVSIRYGGNIRRPTSQETHGTGIAPGRMLPPRLRLGSEKLQEYFMQRSVATLAQTLEFPVSPLRAKAPRSGASGPKARVAQS